MFFSLVKRLHLDGSYIRSWLILAIDLAVSATATLVAFLGIDYFVRNSGFSLLHYLFLLVSAFFCSAVAFYIFRTYRTVIRHSSLREVWKLGAATLLKELLMLFILWFWPDGMTFKAIGLCVVLDLFVTVCMLITVRVLMILLYDAIILSHIRRTNRIRTLVYGVESKEVALVMRLQNSPHYDMCGFSGVTDKSDPHYGLYDYKRSFGSVYTERIGEFDYIRKPARTARWKKADRFRRRVKRKLISLRYGKQEKHS